MCSVSSLKLLLNKKKDFEKNSLFSLDLLP